MALKALAVIEQAGALDPVAAVDALGPALLTPAKCSALRALRILHAAVGDDAAVIVRATPIVVTALGHDAPDVQRQALARLRAWHTAVPPASLGDLSLLADECHPSARAELHEWCELPRQSDPTSSRSATVDPTGADPHAPVRVAGHSARLTRPYREALTSPGLLVPARLSPWRHRSSSRRRPRRSKRGHRPTKSNGIIVALASPHGLGD